MKNKIFGIILVSLLYGCDPMDDRMVFYNNGSEDIFVRAVFIDEEVKGTMVSLRPVSSNSKKTIGILYTWESEFENSGDGILSIVVLNNYEFLNDIYDKSSHIKSDSLLKIGDYKVHGYTYEDLERRDWQIKFPDDGFKKGKPLNIPKRSKPRTPDPEILKEKGIKDRWNKTDSL